MLEYHVVYIGQVTDKALATKLNELAAAGWELVTVSPAVDWAGMFLFMRHKMEENEN